MWESIKNKFKRKKHTEEEVEEAVVIEEEQNEEKTEIEHITDKSDESDMEVENTESEAVNDEISQEIKPEDIEEKEKPVLEVADVKEKEKTALEVADDVKEKEEPALEVSDDAKEKEENVLEVSSDIEEKEETASEKPKKKGFFGKLIDGLTKTRDSFVSGLENVFSGFSEIDEDFYEELEEVLIMADIGVATTEKIIENLQEKVKENKIKEVAVCRQLLVDSIKEQMRVHEDAYDFENKKSVVMLIGVNGVGKTTSVGKLASQFKADGKKVILAAADTFRAAAIEQLTEWSNRAGVELIAGQEGGDPAAVVFDAINAAKARNADILICDTAGRLHNKKNLMEELKKINRIVEREYPDACRETFVVLDGTTGQNALAQARQFSEVADITGIILTKLDGTAKGGIAIAIQSEMNIPVKYIGIGEHIEDLQKFDADAFVDALFDTTV